MSTTTNYFHYYFHYIGWVYRARKWRPGKGRE